MILILLTGLCLEFYPPMMHLWPSRRPNPESTRIVLSQARNELEFVRANPFFCCDVCGPCGHYFHVCYDAASAAVRGLLAFQGQNVDKFTELSRLVDLTFPSGPRRDACSAAASKLSESASAFFRTERTPTQNELDTARTLAEEVLAIVEDELSAG